MEFEDPELEEVLKLIPHPDEEDPESLEPAAQAAKRIVFRMSGEGYRRTDIVELKIN
jgi:hypothetical protein